jgi:uncharacterized oxidoreductase
MKNIFITGGTSGIGLGLAKAFHSLGAHVVVGGRNEEGLRAVAQNHPGIDWCVVDVSQRASIERAQRDISLRFPNLDGLINNAGIQHTLSFAEDVSLDLLESEIDTNFRGLIQMTAAFLPLLRKQPSATLVQVSSGLAFVPLIAAPVYSATKAAVHSFTVALREQLKGGSVKVVELIPPLVETNLHRDQAREVKNPMPLHAFIKEAMAGLQAGTAEINVGRVGVLRVGARVAPSRFLKIINSA